MKRHVLETCLFMKGYLPGYIYRTLIVICTHPISIFYIIYNLHLLSYNGCICLRSILNISATYMNFDHYIGIRGVRSSGRLIATQRHVLRSKSLIVKFINIVAVEVFHYKNLEFLHFTINHLAIQIYKYIYMERK